MIVQELKPYKYNGFAYDIVVSQQIGNTKFGNRLKAIVKHDKGYEVIICVLTKFTGLRDCSFRPDRITHYWRKPTSEEFGSMGWYYTNPRDAMKKYEEV